MDLIHCFSCRRFLNSELPKGGQRADQGDIVGIWVAFIIIVVLVLFIFISICKCSIRLHNSSQSTCSPQPNTQIQQELVDLQVFIFGAKTSPSTSTLPSSTSPSFALSDESCAICLDEYANGQSIRVLPRCKHMFHKDCIDQWLSSHSSSSCPICRERILEKNVKPTRIDMADVNSVPLPILPFSSGRTLNSL